MAITERAAALSPKSRILKPRREAEKPAEKRTGAVPRPKNTMVRNPLSGSGAVAALTIIAQESMQGKNPAASPRSHFEPRPRD